MGSTPHKNVSFLFLLKRSVNRGFKDSLPAGRWRPAGQDGNVGIPIMTSIEMTQFILEQCVVDIMHFYEENAILRGFQFYDT